MIIGYANTGGTIFLKVGQIEVKSHNSDFDFGNKSISHSPLNIIESLPLKFVIE